MIQRHATKCIVGGCVRDCMPYLSESLKNIKRLEALFDEIYVVIAFDQSRDKSLEILQQHKPLFAHFDILVHSNPLSIIRTERIANARNAIIDYTDGLLTIDEYPFLIMMDMDDVCAAPIRLGVIERNIGRNDWDALSFNRDQYYDIWGLSISPYLISCWHYSPAGYTNVNVVKMTRKYIIERLRTTPADELLEVYSAFNGFAIYRRSKFQGCRYKHYFPLNTLTPEQFLQTQETMKKMPFPHIKTFQYNETIPEDCEHRAFHFEAIAKHGAKICISPEFLF